MKTAVSIPDEVFQEAERLARQLGRSRSDLYSRALREYLARHAPERITEAVNAVVREVGEQPEPFLKTAARRTFARTKW